MSGVGRTEAVSVHKLRRNARAKERAIQQWLDCDMRPSDVPEWARGVRVERIGPFCHAVIATEERGH